MRITTGVEIEYWNSNRHPEFGVVGHVKKSSQKIILKELHPEKCDQCGEMHMTGVTIIDVADVIRTLDAESYYDR